MRLSQKQRKRMDIYLVHRFTMRIQVDGSSSFLDRVFYSSGKHFAHKPGASVAVARRGGTATTFDVLNKYFGITQMITVGSTYWNQVHGRNAEDAAKDLEVCRRCGTSDTIWRGC